jgi:hypothetical protein
MVVVLARRHAAPFAVAVVVAVRTTTTIRPSVAAWVPSVAG